MKSQFIEAKSKQQAEKLAPWAEIIVKVEGGYHAFESAEDYRIWKQQK
jgi:hypothetical protein